MSAGTLEEMHPSIEATLCDWLRTADPSVFKGQERTPLAGYNEFLKAYHVDDWGITHRDYGQFFSQVVHKLRCGKCGEKAFPYFLAGDKECIRCLT